MRYTNRHTDIDSDGEARSKVRWVQGHSASAGVWLRVEESENSAGFLACISVQEGLL